VLSRSMLLVHTPPFAAESASAAVGTDARSVDVLLLRNFAAGSGSTAAAEWTSAGLTTETFDMSRLVQSPSELAPSPSPSTAPASAAWEELRAVLGRTKLVLTDTTTRRYWTPELSYAMAAGALVLSDAPNENRRVFRHCSVELPPGTVPKQAGGSPPGAIRELVRHWASAGQAAARKAKVDAGLRFSKLNLGPATFLETLTESYYEVVSPPYGEGLVGKKFPWAYTVMCRSDGGEEW